MKIRKYSLGNNGGTTLAVLNDERWIRLDLYAEKTGDRELKACSDDLIAFLQYYETNGEHLKTGLRSIPDSLSVSPEMKKVIPFRPILFRDFLLSEKHRVNAARGLVRTTMPKLYPFVRGYETIFHTTFPKLKPTKAFYRHPLYYKGNHLSFFTDGEDIAYPSYATLRDYELEIGMIITKEIHDATEQQGLDAIGGFCVLNDFSARNMQYEEMFSTGPCKSKDFASAISDTVVTADEVVPYLSSLRTKVEINGKTVAVGKTDCFQYSLGAAAAYASKGELVHPGELMGSGTVANCCGLENGHFLEHGDTVCLKIEHIGSLTNKIL